MASLFVNELTVIDFSYLHADRGIVGESWIVDVILDGHLNDEGMVFDFGLVKKRIKQAIDEGVDHKFLIPAKMAGLSIHKDDEEFHFNFKNNSGFELDYKSPREAIYLLNSDELKREELIEVMQKHLLTIVPENVAAVKLRLYPQEITGAYYHYSHGLKKHQGDCQRICHGHRSPIFVYRNGQRDALLEEEVSRNWQDIYLITKEDILARNNGLIKLGYESDQGYFEVQLSESRCYLFETDTTVELIADHLLDWLQQKNPNDQLEIHAFEGFKKGAIAASTI